MTVTNNTGGEIGCAAFLVEPGSTIENIDNVPICIRLGSSRPVRASDNRGRVEPAQVLCGCPGEYQVEWGCRGTGEVWGTEMAWSSGATTEPTFVTVPAPSSPFGSISPLGS
ncbi:hypothetical protein GS902_23480 [Rhodococcus hoagii]|nr:hypothetical protein [Prescottella equi]